MPAKQEEVGLERSLSFVTRLQTYRLGVLTEISLDNSSNGVGEYKLNR